MTLFPFEDLPIRPTRVVGSFPDFWAKYPKKVGKKKAITAYLKAEHRASAETILAGLERYKRNKPDYCDWMHPTTFLNGDHWEDEYDTPHKVSGAFQGQSLETIAQIAVKPWARCRYPRDVLEQCVEAGLLTVEQKDSAL